MENHGDQELFEKLLASPLIAADGIMEKKSLKGSENTGTLSSNDVYNITDTVKSNIHHEYGTLTISHLTKLQPVRLGI